MAQKNKKQVRKTPRSTTVIEANGSETEATVVSSTVSGPTSSRSFTSEFNPDYSETIKDLKRIAILAGTFFGILIVLALILP